MSKPKSVLDILIEQGEFQKSGVPTREYAGLDDSSIPEATSEYLSQNPLNDTNESRRPFTFDDPEAASVFEALRQAAKRDSSLGVLLDRVSSLDDFLVETLSNSELGSAYLIGFQSNRYLPEGLGEQYPTDPESADNEKLQFVRDGAVTLSTMRREGEDEAVRQVLSPPKGDASRFTSGVISGNSANAVNEVETFYGENEEDRPTAARPVNSDVRPTLDALKDHNLATAVDTPTENSFLFQTLKHNRFRPLIQGNELTLGKFIGAEEFSSDSINHDPDNNDELPFEDAQLMGEQFGRNYRVSPKSPDEESPGGLAILGKKKIEQISQRQPSFSGMGSPIPIPLDDEEGGRPVEDMIRQLSDGDEVKTDIRIGKVKNVTKTLPNTEVEVENSRYIELIQNDLDNLPESVRASRLEYFKKLEQKAGQYNDKETPGLRELGLVHLMVEMSRISTEFSGDTYPYQEAPFKPSPGRDEQNFKQQVGSFITGGLQQAGNAILRTVQNDLGRITGINRQIGRALMAPRGSSLRETLKAVDLIGEGAQTQNSKDAKKKRLNEADRKMRELFNQNDRGTRDLLRPLKDRYKEGGLIAGNPDGSFTEYSNMFIGLAEDVQTVKHFLTRKGAERFYLSMNQVQISPINRYKGRGMEGFGIPVGKMNRQNISNSTNMLGNAFGVDVGNVANFVAQTAAPVAEAIRRTRGQREDSAESLLASQPQLIMGKSQPPNLLGTSRALEVMHSPLVGQRAGNIFQAYIRTEESSDDANLNALTLISQQLGRSSNLATGKLPSTSMINDYNLDRADAIVNELAGTDPDQNESQGDGRKVGRRLKNASAAISKITEDIGSKIGSAQGGIFTAKIRQRLEEAGSNVQLFNRVDEMNIGSSARITPEAVKLVEDSLEATYCPFYFQDLRTNELISFHAFLKSAKDSFTPDWKKNSYIGRVDPVGTYGGSTERKISIEFSVFATSPEDFGVLYDKINRFIGLCYPQYDEGVRIETLATQNFTNGTSGAPVIPFSQRQIASPIIRLRVGDIIKSAAYDDNDGNVPAINLESMRYLGIQDIILDASSVNNQATTLTETQANLENRIGDLNEEFREALATGGVTSVVVEGEAVPVGSLTFVNDDGEVTIPAEFAEENITAVKINGTVEQRSLNELQHAKFIEAVAQIDTIINSVTTNINTEISEFNNSLDAYLADRESIERSQTINRGNEVIKRSFREIGGRGLAGFIDGGIDLDLLSEYPWETSPGLRAPMGFDISFSFTVIHDVPPGINHKGQMRPVYWPKEQQAQIGPEQLLFSNVAPSFDRINEVVGSSGVSGVAADQPHRPRSSRRLRGSGAIVHDFEITQFSENVDTSFYDGDDVVSDENATSTDTGFTTTIEHITIMSSYVANDPLEGATDVLVDGLTIPFRITSIGNPIPVEGERVAGLDTFPQTFAAVPAQSIGGIAVPGPEANVAIRMYEAVPVGQADLATSHSNIRGSRVRRA